MARLLNQKRKHAGESSQADVDHPLKKTKSRSELEIWKSWENPPEFYDRLSKISLTHRALREFNKRTLTQRSPSLPVNLNAGILLGTTTRDLIRFSRHGGPDLCDLRGYPHPPADQLVAMSTSRSSRSRRTRSSNTASTLSTSAMMKSKKSSPYDRDFDLHLTQNLVHPIYSSQKPDLEEITAAMAIRRPSLSPFKFSDGAFKAFQEADARVKDEEDVLANIIPIILGPEQASRFCARNTVFGNLEPLTDGTIVAPKPDIYYGSYPEELAPSALNELAGHIVPSSMLDKPMVPNVFIEAKGPGGSGAVAVQQIRYVGAVGSRGMHSLQNYHIGEPQYDGKPYTFGFTYHNGCLKSYAHHMTAPIIEGGRPEYHVTQVDVWGMSGNRRAFTEGASALRNTLDLAERYRVNFIRDANARASQTETVIDRNGPK